MAQLAFSASHWDITGVSHRTVTVEGFGVFSGHDGARLSVLGGGWIGCITHNDATGAEAFETALDTELRRESFESRYLKEARRIVG